MDSILNVSLINNEIEILAQNKVRRIDAEEKWNEIKCEAMEICKEDTEKYSERFDSYGFSLFKEIWIKEYENEVIQKKLKAYLIKKLRFERYLEMKEIRVAEKRIAAYNNWQLLIQELKSIKFKKEYFIADNDFFVIKERGYENKNLLSYKNRVLRKWLHFKDLSIDTKMTIEEAIQAKIKYSHLNVD